MALVKITQERSKIRCLEKHKRTLAALGLRRIRHSVVKQDTPQIRGMIALVSYLVRVEPVSAAYSREAASSSTAGIRTVVFISDKQAHPLILTAGLGGKGELAFSRVWIEGRHGLRGERVV